MPIGKDNRGGITGGLEPYISDPGIVTVNAHGNFSTILGRDHTTGKAESRTFFGKPLLPSVFEPNKK